ncbi:MAG: ribonuclease HI family protein [Acidobacteriaceae bacterium]
MPTPIKPQSGLFRSTEPAHAPSGSGFIQAHCDGGARGNPGPAGFGVYIQDEDGTVLAELSEFIGVKSNNVAEYSGLLASLEWALQNGHTRLRVVSDSELMVKQIKGQYKVASPDLRPLYEEAKRRIARLEAFRIEHALRAKNKHADRLANLAMDRGMGRVPAGTAAARAPESRVAGQSLAAPAKAREAAAPTRAVPYPNAEKMLRGFVKGGVVHILGGDLPEGVFVKVIRE